MGRRLVVHYREPERYRAIAPEAVDALLSQRGSPATIAEANSAESISWLDLFRYRTVWGMMIGLFCLNFAIYFFITWFPSYLLQSRGFSLASLGTWGMMPALLAIPGGWLGGLVSDGLFKRGWSATAARKTCLVLGMLLSSSIALSAYVESIWACLALFSLAYASLSFARRRTSGPWLAKLHLRRLMSPRLAVSRTLPVTSQGSLSRRSQASC